VLSHRTERLPPCPWRLSSGLPVVERKDPLPIETSSDGIRHDIMLRVNELTYRSHDVSSFTMIASTEFRNVDSIARSTSTLTGRCSLVMS